MLVTPKCVCFPVLAMGLCLNPIYSTYLSNAIQLSYCLFVPAMILQQEVFLPIHVCVWHLCVCTGVGPPLPQISRLFSGNVFLRTCSSLLLSSPCAQEGNFVIFFPFCVAKPRHGPASMDQPACLPWGGLPEQDDCLTSTSCVRQGQSQTCSGVAQEPRARRCLF